MARRPRVNMAGFHHIVNRGIARDNIYRCDEDKKKYLYDLFRYIEHNPIEAKITDKIGEL